MSWIINKKGREWKMRKKNSNNDTDIKVVIL